jgi:hypothetical protein
MALLAQTTAVDSPHNATVFADVQFSIGHVQGTPAAQLSDVEL